MGKIADIQREVYVAHKPDEGAPVVGVRYLGKGLRREETLGIETSSDWSQHHRVRTSEDNGRTWSDWLNDPHSWPAKDGYSREQMPVAWCDDPDRDVIVRFIFHRMLEGEAPDALREYFRTGRQTMFDHNYYQLSFDDGRTWSDMKQLRYEDGDALRASAMYGSYSAIATRDGAIVYPAAGIPIDLAGVPVSGVRCFVGQWDDAARDYAWEVSAPIAVPHSVSGRGLLEPTIAELTDGRLLVEMRSSTVAVEPQWKGKTTSPGRRWISLSDDGGQTFGDVTDLRYDDGESFYSPSTLALLRRHSGNGKLYWFGNITPQPPDGNLPRYPLVMAEVDERMPALRRDTVALIDDRDPASDSPKVQFSNFSIIEDRQTGAFELYMTRYGERASHWLHADAYRYTIRLK